MSRRTRRYYRVRTAVRATLAISFLSGALILGYLWPFVLVSG